MNRYAAPALRAGLAVVALIAAPVSARAQDATGSLVGQVVDSSGRGVFGAEVRVVSAGRRMITDSTGRFHLRELAAQLHSVQVRRVGYAVARDTVSVVAGSETQLRVVLIAQVAALDTVETVARGGPSIGLRNFEERRARGIGRFIAEEELRANETRALADLLANLSGIKVVSYRAGRYLESTRGGARRRLPRLDPLDRFSPRGCWVTVFVDGLPWYNQEDQQVTDLNSIKVLELGGVELYTGANVPIEYSRGRAGECGVLLLWTRDR